MNGGAVNAFSAPRLRRGGRSWNVLFCFRSSLNLDLETSTASPSMQTLSTGQTGPVDQFCVATSTRAATPRYSGQIYPTSQWESSLLPGIQTTVSVVMLLCWAFWFCRISRTLCTHIVAVWAFFLPYTRKLEETLLDLSVSEMYTHVFSLMPLLCQQNLGEKITVLQICSSYSQTASVSTVHELISLFFSPPNQLYYNKSSTHFYCIHDNWRDVLNYSRCDFSSNSSYIVFWGFFLYQ